MNQHAKKSANHSANYKKSSFRTLEAVKIAEKKVSEMEREGMENAIQMVDGFNEAALEYVAACSDNLSACIESGNKATHALQNIDTEVMECCNRLFSDMAEISKKAITCRSMNDMIELQDRIIQQVSDNLTALNKLSGMLFDYFGLAMKPFSVPVVSTSDHLNKARAA